MCIPSPSVPQPVIRQTAQSPDNGSANLSAASQLQRRMGLAATVLSGPGGVMTPAATTAGKPTLGS